MLQQTQISRGKAKPFTRTPAPTTTQRQHTSSSSCSMQQGPVVLPNLFQGFWITIFVLTAFFCQFGECDYNVTVDVSNSTLCFVQNCSSFLVGEPIHVDIGSFINDVAMLDVDASTIRFDAYLWMKWPVCTANPNGEILRPDQTISIYNTLVRVDTTLSRLYNEPVCDAFPGYAYMIWRLEGLFSQKMSFKRFPLDFHWMYVKIEEDLFPRKYLKYKPEDGSGMHESVRLSGWKIQKFVQMEQISQYDSDFGTSGDTYSGDYSQYKYGVKISRGVAVYAWRVLPPISITAFICIMVMLLDVEALDIRLGTAVAGLTAEIFLQLTFSSLLPTTDYLTVMDHIFNLCYFIILLIMVESLVVRKIYYTLLFQEDVIKDEIKLQALGASHVTQEEVVGQLEHVKEKKEKIKRRIRKGEKFLFAAFGVAYFLAVLIISLAGQYAGGDPEEYL